MSSTKRPKPKRPKDGKAEQKSGRPRGRPPRTALGHEDAEAIRSLQDKMQSLDEKLQTLNELISVELTARQPKLVRDDSNSTDYSGATLARSPTSAEFEEEKAEGQRKDWSKSHPVVTVDPSRQLAGAPFQDALVERFVDSYTPTATTTESNFWIHDGRPWLLWRYGAEACASSPLLHSAYLAVSSAYAGLSLKDDRLTQAGALSYSAVLQSLQRALNDPEMGKSDAVLMTVGLCMNYELDILISNTQGRLSREAKAGYSVHVAGVLRLFEFRGPDRHRSGLAHYFFVDARLYCTWGTILSRTPSFLSTADWKLIPWSLGTTDKDLIQHLFDEMLEIPKMLWYLDQCMTIQGPFRKMELRETTLGVAKEVKAGLERWKSKWLDRMIWRRPHEKDLNCTNPNLPVFRHPDPKNPAKYVEPPALVYPNGALFAAVLNYYAAHLLVNDTICRLKGERESPAQTSIAHDICRSLSYFLVHLPPSMLGRIAFAVVAAYDVLPVGGSEREYLKEVYGSCVGGSWRHFEDFVQEFSVLQRGPR